MLEVTDPGGHSASGRRDNAIYRLADALRRLSAFDFPPALNSVTRSFFQEMAKVETPPTADAMTGQPVFTGVPVRVERVAGPATAP